MSKLSSLSPRLRKKLRFGIGEEGKLFSEVWTIWYNRSDVYLTSKAFGGRIKLSLHQSGVCQYAFTKEFWDKSSGVFGQGFQDRTWHRWNREHALGRSVIHTVSVIFTSCEQWNEYNQTRDLDATLLPPPPHGYCFEIAIFFSAVPYREYADPTSSAPMVEFELENGEFLTAWPIFIKLPKDYFDFRRIEGGIVEFGPVLAGKGNDVRGISVVHLSQLEGEPLRIHSSHNMRLVTVQKGEKMPVYRRDLSWWGIIGWVRNLLGAIRR